MSKSISAALLIVLTLVLAVVGAALLAAAVQLGVDLAGPDAVRVVDLGEDRLVVETAELQTSFVVAITLGLLFVVPAALFGRKALKLLRASK